MNVTKQNKMLQLIMLCVMEKQWLFLQHLVTVDMIQHSAMCHFHLVTLDMIQHSAVCHSHLVTVDMIQQSAVCHSHFGPLCQCS
jgi:hypothetical protein